MLNFLDSVSDNIDKPYIVFRVTLFFFILFACAGGCGYFNEAVGLKNDNPFEQAIELEIKAVTGLDTDLTPNQ